MSAVGVAIMGELASVSWQMRREDALIVAELKAGNEDAYARLIAQYHQTIYNLTYRLLDDPSEAPDTTQEVFIKIFRGISKFNSESSLKTWIYRIAVNEASNRRRWFFRHKVKELSIEPAQAESEGGAPCLRDSLIDDSESPFESVARDQVRAHLEQVLQELPEHYRTAVVLRDIEDLSYEEIAAMTATSLGTVKSRLVRGREALRKRMQRCAHELGSGAGIFPQTEAEDGALTIAPGPQEIEVTP